MLDSTAVCRFENVVRVANLFEEPDVTDILLAELAVIQPVQNTVHTIEHPPDKKGDNRHRCRGHHCCQILHDRLNVNSSVRVSFGVYNNKDDILVLDEAIKKCQKIFG